MVKRKSFSFSERDVLGCMRINWRFMFANREWSCSSFLMDIRYCRLRFFLSPILRRCWNKQILILSSHQNTENEVSFRCLDFDGWWYNLDLCSELLFDEPRIQTMSKFNVLPRVYSPGTHIDIANFNFFDANHTAIRVAITGGQLSDIMQFCCVKNGQSLCDSVTSHCGDYMGTDPYIDYGIYIPNTVTEYWVTSSGGCKTHGSGMRHSVLEACA